MICPQPRSATRACEMLPHHQRGEQLRSGFGVHLHCPSSRSPSLRFERPPDRRRRMAAPGAIAYCTGWAATDPAFSYNHRLTSPAHPPISAWSPAMRPDRTCAACGAHFTPLPHVPNQRYCSLKACQLARRRDWQRERVRTDPDYRANQAKAQATWSARHPDYWRRYRETRPAYRDRNRAMQQERNARRNAATVAKMDASPPFRPLTSGFYLLSDALEAGIAKMNAWTVHIAVLSAPRPPTT
ncbi:hypothetical protein QFZ98_008242 [Paraburkholderia youngii]